MVKVQSWLADGLPTTFPTLNPGEMGAGEIVGLLREEYSTIYTATRSSCKWRNYKLLRRSLYKLQTISSHGFSLADSKQSNGFYKIRF